MADLENSAAYCLGRIEAELELATAQASVDYLQVKPDDDAHWHYEALGYMNGLGAALDIVKTNLTKIGWADNV